MNLLLVSESSIIMLASSSITVKGQVKICADVEKKRVHQAGDDTTDELGRVKE